MDSFRVPAPADPVRYLVQNQTTMGDTPLRVALALAVRYPGGLPTSVSALARETGRGVDTVKAAIPALIEAGIATWVEVGSTGQRRVGLVVHDDTPTQAPLPVAPVAPPGASGTPWDGRPAAKGSSAQADLFGALAALRGVNPKSMSAKTRTGIAAAARRIRKQGGDADLVAGPVTKAWRQDWRGRKGSRPSLSQIEDLVGVCIEAAAAADDSPRESNRKAAWRAAMAEWLSAGGPKSGKPKPAPLTEWKETKT